MELNQSVEALSAQTVGKGYFDAVTLMWSPSALVSYLSMLIVTRQLAHASARLALDRRNSPKRYYVNCMERICAVP